MELDLSEYQAKAQTTAMYPDLYQLSVGRLLHKRIISEVVFNSSHPDMQAAPGRTLKDLMKNPYYPALGLAGEVGEFCNKLKKVMRDNNGEITPEFLDFAEDELGDVLWYVAACASELGLNLAAIGKRNLEKLASRKERGKIQGSGDTR